MKTRYVVTSMEHVERLFPEPGRDALREACRLMLEAGAALVVLTPGHYEVFRLENGSELQLRVEGDNA